MATSKLQRRVSDFLSVHFGEYTIRENCTREWLITPEGNKLQLDFLIEELGLAIEVQGIQHYRYVPHFHITPEGFERSKYFDTFKKDACTASGILLIEVCDEADVINLAEYKPAPKNSQFVPDKSTGTYLDGIQAQEKRRRVAKAGRQKMFGESRRLSRRQDHTLILEKHLLEVSGGIWSAPERIVLVSWAFQLCKKMGLSDEEMTNLEYKFSVDLSCGMANYTPEMKSMMSKAKHKLKGLNLIPYIS